MKTNPCQNAHGVWLRVLLALSAILIASPHSMPAQSQAKESTNSAAFQSGEVEQKKSYSNGFSTMKANPAMGCNGSFEYSEAGLPVNWAVYPPLVKKKGCELKFDSTDPKDGKQSLEFAVRECSDIGGWHSPGIFQHRIILPGRNYKTTFWLKNTGCRFKVDLATIKDPTHGHYDTVLRSSQVLTNWTKFEFTTQSYPGATSFRFELNIFSPGNLWIDDLEVREVETEKNKP